MLVRPGERGRRSPSNALRGDAGGRRAVAARQLSAEFRGAQGSRLQGMRPAGGLGGAGGRRGPCGTEFAAAEPQAAHALTVDARRRARARSISSRRRSPICRPIRGTVKTERRYTLSTEEALVESIATVIRGHLQLGTAYELPGAGTGLVYITLMPYLGLSEARRWAGFLDDIRQ